MQNYTLDNSKGSQTAIVPKSTYKELQTQPRLAKITAVLHLHNEYKTLKVLIKIPDKYKDYPLWWLNHDDVKRHYKWANHLPLPEDVFGIWKPKVTNRVEDDWNTYDINDNEYYYEINDVNIVRNKKYKAPPVEEKPRLRRRRTNKNDTLEPANDAGWSLDDAIADSNQKLEDLQEQEGISTNKLKELQKQIEEEEERRINILAKQIEFKKEIKELKIKRAKQNNKNGYVILAQDDFAPKEQVYGYSQRFEEAQTIAEEAVKICSIRL
jgi:hypothetical protein